MLKFETQGTLGFPRWAVVENLPVMQETKETQFPSLGWKDLLESEMATYFSILA